jgi:Flp pilus assembly protein TadD
VEAAEVAARHLLELNPQDSGVYSVLAGIYADAARWEDVARVRKLMDERIARRNVGCSSITADH